MTFRMQHLTLNKMLNFIINLLNSSVYIYCHETLHHDGKDGGLQMDNLFFHVSNDQECIPFFKLP